VLVDRHVVSGGEPPADGMHIAVRLRRDFTIKHDAVEMVTSTADAIFTILEQAGLVGRAIDAALALHAEHGLQVDGWRAQVTTDEMRPLPPGPDCLDRGDVFALPVDP
jgi:hypothetical protein